jgi:hypothetical protein
MMIAPIVDAPFGVRVPCEVCRLGTAKAACFHPQGAFLACILCAQQIAQAVVIRSAFAQLPAPPETLRRA